MIWVTWRQHRTEIIVAGILLVLLAPFLLISGLELRKVYLEGVPEMVFMYVETVPFLAIHILPFLLGLFVGVPLISQELERGTNHLAWTQGITREKWIISKVLWLAGATVVPFILIAGILIWWNQPVNETISPFATFDANGFVIVFHALFAFALGTALGTIIGKPVGAMALFIPIFPLVRLLFIWLRPYYLPPMLLRWNYAGENPTDQGKIWILAQKFSDAFGQPITFEKMFSTCRPPESQIFVINPVLFPCFYENGFSLVARYQPTERFWIFQGIESFIFLALALGLIGLTVWWLKKKGN